MNQFRAILAGAMIMACGAFAHAQSVAETPGENSHKGFRAAHAQAHQQIASANTKMDMSVIRGKIQEDIAKREGLDEQTSKNPMLADIITEARKHLGKPYVHGMKGPKAFDCSGFSSYVYKQFGYKISPASRMQYTEGVKVDRKNLREGDLVFFTSRSSGSNVGHVGIVVSADNTTGDFTFIHASIKGVRISACEGYYARRYVGARRIIQ